MSGRQGEACNACSGTGLTGKTRHSVELDDKGHQVPVAHTFTSACSHCSGTGKVAG
ncbi:hypothetical protein AB0K89_10420 [Streptomyces cinnamoneus]|uniref:hypothetical protein n=1 Tax=Streptomyces cinnamoneus TaxID=53446 RepID=UPI00342B6E96